MLQHTSHLPTNTFLNAMQTLSYFPHISRPTRFPECTQLGQPSLLDHIWTNFTPASLSGILHYYVSDHLPVFINISNQSVPNTNHEISFRILISTIMSNLPKNLIKLTGKFFSIYQTLMKVIIILLITSLKYIISASQ